MLDRHSIIAIYESKERISKLAKNFGISEKIILLIRLGKLYRTITKELCPGYLHARQGKQGQHKLEQVEIEYILTSDESYRILGEMFGVSKDCIFDAKKGMTWKHLNRDHVVPSRKKSFTGEASPKAKLTDVQVQEIIARAGSTTITQLAKEYGVDNGTISAIRRGVTWKHLTRPPIKPNSTKKGLRHYNCRLTCQQAEEVITSALSGAALAKKFGVHSSTITRFRRKYKELNGCKDE